MTVNSASIGGGLRDLSGGRKGEEEGAASSLLAHQPDLSSIVSDDFLADG
jgi:hypothetical protein